MRASRHLRYQQLFQPLNGRLSALKKMGQDPLDRKDRLKETINKAPPEKAFQFVQIRD